MSRLFEVPNSHCVVERGFIVSVGISEGWLFFGTIVQGAHSMDGSSGDKLVHDKGDTLFTI